MAGSITESFLGFRCPSPSGGCREVKYPKCPGRGWWQPPGQCPSREEGVWGLGSPSGLCVLLKPSELAKTSKIKTGVKGEHSSARSFYRGASELFKDPKIELLLYRGKKKSSHLCWAPSPAKSLLKLRPV